MTTINYMPGAERKSLTVRTEVHSKAVSRYEQEKEKNKTDMSFINWFSEYILLNLEKDEYIASYAPFLEKIGIRDNRLIIRDKKRDKLTDIFLKDGKFFCNLDEKNDCEHIHFALAMPELVRLKSKN